MTEHGPVSQCDEHHCFCSHFQEAEQRITALEAALVRAEVAAVRAFVARVNARAEARMQAGHPLEGSHWMAMQAELAALEAAGADAGEDVTDG